MSTKQSFKKPWKAIEDYPQGHRVALEKEAFVEIAEDHPLYGLKLYAVARRDDCDDVLFQVTDSETVAVVHLTWSRRVEPPSTGRVVRIDRGVQSASDGK